MDTIWQRDGELPRFPTLEGDIQTDVLVIGGGLAGLLTAWNLNRAGVDCVLIEANRLLQGVSGRTTAKLTSQHGLIYHRLLKTFGPEKARLYYLANEDALVTYRELARSWDFDFSPRRNYVYATGDTALLEREQAACERLRIPTKWVSETQLPFPVSGALCFEDQAQFHPLKFARHLACDLTVYEHTEASSVNGNTVKTPRGTITAEKIVVATHFPVLNTHGLYFMKLYQQRSYVIALENAGELEGMYLDSAENGLSLRSAGEYLLLGGGGHRTGKPGQGWKAPEEAAKTWYPRAGIVSRWATQDCMTLDGIPYVGRYSRGTPDLYVATGFQKWGMTTAMAAAMILSDLIREKQNLYAPIFEPSRGMLHKQLLINGISSAENLLRLSKPRCPHLGCALRWNEMEHSWDCPCHGSRFSSDGKLLNNPATGDLKNLP